MEDIGPYKSSRNANPIEIYENSDFIGSEEYLEENEMKGKKGKLEGNEGKRELRLSGNGGKFFLGGGK